MTNQGEQDTRTLGETAEMLRDKVLQMEKHLQEIGRKIKEVDRLLEMVGNPLEGVPQEQYYGNVPEGVRDLVLNYIPLERSPMTPREETPRGVHESQEAGSDYWVIESDPQEESEPQRVASEPVEEEEPEEEEEDPQDVEEEELEPIDIEAGGEEESFGMFPEFAEEENDANEESDYYAPTDERSDF
ncbi:protein SQS1-like [Lycium barbarum]|uniref:protein SQS1-like n=1 Tax=Lycium barbarum TaxID=112863 RepID=UPI00293E7B0C|nr:protein SQS1-like [Lycium barbarum]